MKALALSCLLALCGPLAAEEAPLPNEVKVYAAIAVAQAQMQDGQIEAARASLEDLQSQGLALDNAAGVDFCLYYSLVLRSGPPDTGRIAKSLEVAQRAFKLEPSSNEVRLNLARAWVKRGWNLNNRKDPGLSEALDKAEAAFKAVDREQDALVKSDVHNGLGQVDFMRLRFEEAAKSFEAALALAPRGAIHRNLGWSYRLAYKSSWPCSQRLESLRKVVRHFEAAVAAKDTNKATDSELEGCRIELKRLEAACK